MRKKRKANSAGLQKMSKRKGKKRIKEEDYYEVEKITADRYIKDENMTEYLVKWVGYGDESNSWVRQDELNCSELIAAYEVSRQNGHTEVESPEPEEENSKNQIIPLVGFERGLEPEKILAATDNSGTLLFVMKWKESDEYDFVPAEEANERCPQIVIQFYEEHTIHNSPQSNYDEPCKSEEQPDGSSKITNNGAKPTKSTEEEEEDTEENAAGPSGVNDSDNHTKDIKITGFKNGLKAEEVLTVTEETPGQLLYLIKWAGVKQIDLVRAKDASIQCPQVVIKYYEKHLAWSSLSSEENESDSN